jgi:mRNA-degrading endonuclease RelE of RelBE toxin-antitoxin system
MNEELSSAKTKSIIKKIEKISGTFKTDFFKKVARYMPRVEKTIKDLDEGLKESIQKAGKTQLYYTFKLSNPNSEEKKLLIDNSGKIRFTTGEYFIEDNFDRKSLSAIKSDLKKFDKITKLYGSKEDVAKTFIDWFEKNNALPSAADLKKKEKTLEVLKDVYEEIVEKGNFRVSNIKIDETSSLIGYEMVIEGGNLSTSDTYNDYDYKKSDTFNKIIEDVKKKYKNKLDTELKISVSMGKRGDWASLDVYTTKK